MDLIKIASAKWKWCEKKCQPFGPNLNSSLPGQNGHQFADDIFGYIFVNEKFCILIEISLKFVPKGLIDNKPALV